MALIDMSNIKGKIIVITGGSVGLGKAAAKKLKDQGAKVVIGARRPDRLDEAARELGIPKEAAIVTDVTNLESVKALVKAAVDLYGHIDVILNNAGIAPLSRLEALKVDEWDKAIDINLKGILYGIAAALPYFKAQKSGQFVNTGSTSAYIVVPTGAVYAATKAAVVALSEGLRQEVKPYNIRTTLISPGPVQSEIASSTSEVEARKRLSARVDNGLPDTSFADVVAFAIDQPENVDINEIVFRPTSLGR